MCFNGFLQNKVLTTNVKPVYKGSTMFLHLCFYKLLGWLQLQISIHSDMRTFSFMCACMSDASLLSHPACSTRSLASRWGRDKYLFHRRATHSLQFTTCCHTLRHIYPVWKLSRFHQILAWSRLQLGWRFNARKRRVKPLRASQSLSETFSCTGYKAFSLKGKVLRGNRVARVGIWAH